MVWAKALPLLIVGFLNVLVGFLVLSRNWRQLINQTFCIFCVSLGGWVIGIAGFLLADSPMASLAWAKAYYIFPLLVGCALVLFGNAFPDARHISLRRSLTAVIACLLLVVPIAVVPHFLITGIVYHDWGKEVLLNHVQYLAYSLYLLAAIAFGLGEILLVARRRNDLYAQQARLFFYGFLFTSVFGVFFNLVLPWVGNYRLIHIGPLFTNILVIFVAYSIIKRKMFDIRLVVVRSITYLFTVGTMAFIFGVIVFSFSRLILDVRLTLAAEVYISLLTAMAALLFNRLKLYFDRVSNSLFYRDSYDAQALLDNLNRLLVNTTNLDYMLKQASEVIIRNLKTEFCFFRIGDGRGQQTIIGNRPYTPEEADSTRLSLLLSKVHSKSKLIVAQDLSASQHELQQGLNKYGVAIVGRLGAQSDSPNLLGYMVLGERSSGNPYRKSDLRVLEIIVNELVIAVENKLRFEEIQQFNETLQEKVNVATHNLRNTNKKLHALDETKDEFITMASHQLRTPLTAIKGYLSMVLEGDAGKLNANQQKLLEQSYSSAQRMVYLISDLLNLSRLNTGKFVIELNPVQLAEVVQSEVDQLQETAHAREVTLNYHKPAELPELMLDETKIHQVVMNFMDNAIYYTPPGGVIDVSVRETPSAVEYLVKDNGIGVPKAEQHRLFTKFYRAGNARAARPDGTGLGLFMAKKVIVAQGGAILFDSQEGKGSSFGFRFNKAHHAAPVVPAAVESVAATTKSVS